MISSVELSHWSDGLSVGEGLCTCVCFGTPLGLHRRTVPSRCRAAWSYTQTATTDNLTAFSVTVPSLSESAPRIVFFFSQILSRIVRSLLLFRVTSLATSSMSFIYHLYLPISLSTHNAFLR